MYQLPIDLAPDEIWTMLSDAIWTAVGEKQLSDCLGVKGIIVDESLEKILYEYSLGKIKKKELASQARKDERVRKKVCQDDGFIYSRLSYRGIPIIPSLLLDSSEEGYMVTII